MGNTHPCTTPTRALQVLATMEPAALALVASSVHAWVAHRDEGVRRRAVELLGKLEPDALSLSFEHILPALDDEDEDVRLVVANPNPNPNHMVT